MYLKTFYKLFIASILFCFLSNNVNAQGATLTVQQDPQITKLLDLKKKLEKENKLTDGYTIQLYYGELNKANDILRRYRGSYPNWSGSIEYETPNYKVWVGNYPTRLDAERALVDIQRNFNSAFILKPERRK